MQIYLGGEADDPVYPKLGRLSEKTSRLKLSLLLLCIYTFRGPFPLESVYIQVVLTIPKLL